MKGVVRVLVGYTGGTTTNPTYRNMGDHTESLLIEFDPEVVSFWEIMRLWQDNDFPWKRQRRQYRSAIFFTNLAQQDEGLLFLQQLQQKHPGRKCYASLEFARAFYRAESYHQNYLAKHSLAHSSGPRRLCLSGVCELPWKKNRVPKNGTKVSTIPE